jgi:hypothetical protein
LHKGLPSGGQLLLLEVGSNLLPDRRLIPLEPGLVSLGGALDLLLGDQSKLGSHLGDERLDLLALEGVNLLFKLGEWCGDGLLDLLGRDRLPIHVGERLPLGGRVGRGR